MLSFYEFDCLINQSKKEINEGGTLNLLKSFFAKKNAGQAAATPAPVAQQAPQQAPQPSAAIKAPVAQQAPQPSAAPTISPAPTALKAPAAKPARQKGSIVNSKPDQNASLSKDEFRKLRGGGDSPLTQWNNMCRSIGNIGGDKVSTWAWAMYDALKEIGVQVPPLQTGQPFQLAFSAGSSGQSDLPEIVVNPQQLRRAEKMIWQKYGNDPTEPIPEKQNSLDAALLQGLVKSQNPQDQEKELNHLKMNMLMGTSPDANIKKRLRAIEFNKLVRHHDLTDKPMTIAQLSQVLGSQAGNGGVGKSSPEEDMQALAHLIKTDIAGKYHTFRIMPGPDGKRSAKLTPNTNILINAPKDLGKSNDELGSADDKNVAQLDAKRQLQRTLANKKKGINALDVPNGQPKVESKKQKDSSDWMDVVEMMEHWGW